MKNIVIMGGGEIEVQGVLSLLEGMGIVAVRLGLSPPAPDDLLIVAMSAEPLLGWAKHLSPLLEMKLRWRCTMVVLTPNEIASIRLLDAVGSIVSGGYSLRWIRNILMYLVTKWRQGKLLPVGNVRRISEVCVLDIEDITYFFTQTMLTTGVTRLNKTEYGRRNRALVNMGFCHLQQLRLFMGNVDPQAVLNAMTAVSELKRELKKESSKNM